MKQAVVLAGGEGRRLRPFTANKPKAMLSVAGKPLIQYVLESLAGAGVHEVILLTGYREKQIFDYIGAGDLFGINIAYLSQDRQLSPAHALLQAKGSTENEFLVLPGDKLIEPRTLSEFINIKPNALLVKKVDNPSRYGVATVEKGKLTGIVEKPLYPESTSVSIGIYAFNTEVFEYLEKYSDIPTVINAMLAEGKNITALETGGIWLDVVYPWDILKLSAFALRQTSGTSRGTVEHGVTLVGSVVVGEGTVIRANSYIVGPVAIGKGCEIGPSAVISPFTSIGDNVTIAPFANIINSVISTDVQIGAFSCIQNSIIDKGCIFGQHFSAYSGEAEVKVEGEHHVINMGAMLGANCRLEDAVTARPGVIVGNNSRVNSLKLISGNIPDNSLLV